jgi:hypothetical protein
LEEVAIVRKAVRPEITVDWSKLALALAGRFDTFRARLWGEPLMVEVVTAKLAEPPATTVSEAGLMLTEKSPALAPPAVVKLKTGSGQFPN